MENTQEEISFAKSKVDEFGAKDDGDYYKFRNNTSPRALGDGGAYFGFIDPSESGPYSDFSFQYITRIPYLSYLSFLV
ncbi:hypothetical protein CN354_16260 [Bacillus cereus]|nr:hypothetical protein CN354_16260 [Bacillus cereus]WJE53611.1 hypothetical protein QRE66_04865 [Bacillus cereus]